MEPAQPPTPSVEALGILAGGGVLPLQLARLCTANGRRVVMVGFPGHTAPEAMEPFDHLWAHFGQAALILDWLHSQNATELTCIGRIRRPSLSEICPDWRAARFLATIALRALGDDGLMRAVAGALEAEGFKVTGAHQLWSDLLCPAGLLGQHQPDPEMHADIARALEVARTLGRLDVGQAVVVQQGMVLGVEAIEGTDQLLERSGKLRREGRGGVLVKVAKPQQDHRLDLPTIGPCTIERAAAAGLAGVAVQAAATLIIDRAGAILRADAAGLCLLGIHAE